MPKNPVVMSNGEESGDERERERERMRERERETRERQRDERGKIRET